ncbi:hypothetical protein Vadar_004049 [Vaccinium darrowii]|uniref:Uncharacterized protein n=1 Tax=Vaccinium darrowii TaxID=229202 RepID=A0ACB7X7E7_9ERIC|nr:hypothetical protein Vadar_004049 [Vaccinium darrowii]
MDKLCLFPGAKLPEGFKPIAWEKFDGSGDPRAHLQTYVGTLSMYNIEKDAMGQMFQQTLTGPALRWFLNLDISRKGSWEDIGAAFMAQYNYNIQLEMTIRELDATKMGTNESFADFIRRWRGKASQMIDRPSEKEQMRIITKNLAPDFVKHLVVFQTTADFRTFYEAGLAVEDALRTGIFEKGESAKPKRVYSGNSNTLFGTNQYSHTQASSSNSKPTKTEPINQIAAQPTRQARSFYQFPFPLTTVYQKLLEKDAIKPLEPREPPKILPPSHNPNAFCSYHQMPGHHTNNCIRLKHKVQDLIEDGTIPLPLKKPNTVSNPMPEHKSNTQINQISLSSTLNDLGSTKFNPSLYIIPDTEPKPLVPVPEDLGILFLGSVKPKTKPTWADMAESEEWAMNDQGWEKFRQEWDPSQFIIPDSHAKPVVSIPTGPSICRIDKVVCIAGMVHTLEYVELSEQEDWRERWEAICADPLDAVSLPTLFEEPGDIWNRTLGEVYHWVPSSHPPDNLLPPPLLGIEEHSAIETVFGDHDWFPQAYIIGESLPRPSVLFPPQPDVSVLRADSFWDEEDVVDIRFDNNEVWTVNRAMLDDSFWRNQAVANLGKKMENIKIEKRKAKDSLTGFWSEYFDTKQKLESIKAGKRKVNEFSDFWNEEPPSVNRVTRSGRIYQPADLQRGNTSNHAQAGAFAWNDPVQDNSIPSNPENVTQTPEVVTQPSQRNPMPVEDPIRKQLERTPASVSIWGLLSSSREHRQKLIKTLSNMEVPPDTPPEALISLLAPNQAKHVVTFTEKDLPPEGAGHNKPLHITMKCMGKWVPVILLDNGSALNVCPLRTAYCLGFTTKDFQPSNLGVRAYDNTRRDVVGIIQLEISVESFKPNVEFHVLDIPSSFNLLLGRPWLHHPDIMAVPSSLHQKVQLGLAAGTLTIYGESGIRPHVSDNAPVLEIIHGEEDVALGGFSFDTAGAVLTIKMDEDFSVSSTVIEMMRKMAYMPGLGLGRNNQGIAEFPDFPMNNHRFSLGYQPNENELGSGWKARARARPKKGNLESLFGNESPLGTVEDGPAAKIFDLEPVGEMELMMLSQEALGDVSSLIVDANGIYKNCIFVPKIIYTGTEFESKSESSTESEFSTEFESTSESMHVSVCPPRHHFSFEFESTLMYHAPGATPFSMNEIDFAYLAVSEINCVNPDDDGIEFEEEIPKELRSLIERENERHAQPIKEEVISINLRDESNPRIVQIGSRLSPEEFKAHSDLLREFQDVFAWSHADMPGIDPEIVEHRIPLYPDAKPVKQKLRKMRPDWVLEIKKEVQKQIDAGFLMVTEYPKWVANIVPVPKKNGKIRVCVDFRDLNKASLKDDFPLPHIDVLVDNTAGHALLSFMDGFSGYNQILMAPEDREKTTFTTEWGTYCYRVMPFGLKNAGSTYQRAATTLLHDMIHKEVEVYVDDMIVKSRERERGTCTPSENSLKGFASTDCALILKNAHSELRLERCWAL